MVTIKKALGLSCLVLILLMGSSCANTGSTDQLEAVEVIGEITLVIGEPLVLRGGKMIILQRRYELQVGDAILTGTMGKVRIKMTDDTVIHLGNNSQFVFHAYSYGEPNPIARMSFVEGSFRVTSKKFMKRTGAIFEIVTPIAVIGIRSTDFWGGYIFGEDQLDVALLGGQGIYVRNNFGEVNIEDVGVGTTVSFMGPPMAPEAWETEKVAEAVAATQL